MMDGVVYIYVLEKVHRLFLPPNLHPDLALYFVFAGLFSTVVLTHLAGRGEARCLKHTEGDRHDRLSYPSGELLVISLIKIIYLQKNKTKKKQVYLSLPNTLNISSLHFLLFPRIKNPFGSSSTLHSPSTNMPNNFSHCDEKN